MKKKLFAVTILFLTAAVWGFGSVAQVLGGDALPAMAFNGLRFLVAAVLLFPLSFLLDRRRGIPPAGRKGRDKRTALAALSAGVMLFCASGLQQLGTAITRDPGKAGFLTSLYTVLTPLLALLLFRRRSPLRVWIGAVMAAVGLYLICLREGARPSFGEGELFLLAGALFWAGHILVVDHFAGEIDAARFSSWQFFTVGALSCVASAAFERVSLTQVRTAAGAILFSGLIAIGTGFTLQVVGQRLLGDPTGSALILSTEAIFSLLGGFLWNIFAPPEKWVDHDILPVGYVGCAVVFLGILLTQVDPIRLIAGWCRRRKRRE